MLYIKNGKFYDHDGNQIQPEFGNPEHLKVLNKYKKAAEGQSLSDIVKDATMIFNFNCLCGYNLEIKAEYTDIEINGYGDVTVNDITADFSEDIIKCTRCNAVYKLNTYNRNDIKVYLLPHAEAEKLLKEEKEREKRRRQKIKPF